MTTYAAPTHMTTVGAPGTPRVVAAANALVAGDKGLLAIDESIPTCNKRFARLGIAQTEHNRRAYRELIVTTPGLADSITGVILCNETIRQHTTAGEAFATVLVNAGIVPGIKVDLGAKPLAAHPGEKVTEGLDGLRERLAEYADALARYAALCQEADLVPIVEPEVLMTGEHISARCGEVTEDVLREVFSQLHTQGVLLEGMLLKTNMILPGLTCPIQPAVEAVADATICCLRRSVPAAVAGIVFLSGGQSGDLATARLNAINAAGRSPLPVAFSYGRAIQQPALTLWDGQETNRGRAQHAIAQRAKANRDARRGEYPNTAILAHT